MSLETVVNSLEGLDENIASLYKQEGDSFVLDVGGIDNHPSVRGLKKNHDQLLSEKKEAEAAKLEAAKAAELAKKEAAKKNGDFEALLKSSESEREKLQQQLNDINARAAREKVNAKSLEIAAQLADGDNVELLSEFISHACNIPKTGLK